MSLKLLLGISQKRGLSDDGSRAATCQLELELDADLMEGDREAFRQRVQGVYDLCAEAVENALARQGRRSSTEPESSRAEVDPAAGERPACPSSPNDAAGANGRVASASQLEYASALASRLPTMGAAGLESFCRKRWQKPLAALNSIEASQLITALRDRLAVLGR